MHLHPTVLANSCFTSSCSCSICEWQMCPFGKERRNRALQQFALMVCCFSAWFPCVFGWQLHALHTHHLLKHPLFIKCFSISDGTVSATQIPWETLRTKDTIFLLMLEAQILQCIQSSLHSMQTVRGCDHVEAVRTALTAQPCTVTHDSFQGWTHKGQVW